MSGLLCLSPSPFCRTALFSPLVTQFFHQPHWVPHSPRRFVFSLQTIQTPMGLQTFLVRASNARSGPESFYRMTINLERKLLLKAPAGLMRAVAAGGATGADWGVLVWETEEHLRLLASPAAATRSRGTTGSVAESNQQ